MAGAPEHQLSDLSFTQHIDHKKKFSFLILDDSILKVFNLPRLLEKNFNKKFIGEIILISNNTPPVIERIRPYFPKSMKSEIVNSPLEWLSIAQVEYDRLTENSDSLTVVLVDFNLGKIDNKQYNTLPFIEHIKKSNKETTLLIGISAQGAEAIKRDEQFREFSSSVVENLDVSDPKFISEIASIIATKFNKFFSIDLLPLLSTIDGRKQSLPAGQVERGREPVDSERRHSSAEIGPLVAAGFFPEGGGHPIPMAGNTSDFANIGPAGISLQSPIITQKGSDSGNLTAAGASSKLVGTEQRKETKPDSEGAPLKKSRMNQ